MNAKLPIMKNSFYPCFEYKTKIYVVNYQQYIKVLFKIFPSKRKHLSCFLGINKREKRGNMRKRERIISVRKHSTGKASNENLWFFSEDSVLNSSPIPEKKSGKHDSLKVINENYNPFMSKTSERNKQKKECAFVVDWQMSDSLQSNSVTILSYQCKQLLPNLTSLLFQTYLLFRNAPETKIPPILN